VSLALLTWSAPFDELVVGQRFATRGRTVTEADVVGFSQLTGDWHPQHADAHWAAEGPFGERIAHGMLVISFAAGLVPFDPDRVVALRRVADATFKRPVRFGDTIRVEGRVEELKAVGEDAGLVGLSWIVRNQDGQPTVRARVEVLWRRDPVPDPHVRAADGSVPIPL